MTTFKNSSFDVRVKRSRQVTSAYSLRGYITRSILSKFGASEYIEIDGLYAAAIKRIVGEMDVEVSKNNKESWIFIPVRSAQEVIDKALFESYQALTEEEDEIPAIEEEVQPDVVEEPVEVEPIAQPVEEVIQAQEQNVIVEPVAQPDAIVEPVKVEPVVAPQGQPAVHNGHDQRQNGRNNNYAPRNNNNQNNYKK